MELLDTVLLFASNEYDEVASNQDTFGLLITHLRQLVYPEVEGRSSEQDCNSAREKTLLSLRNARLELV